MLPEEPKKLSGYAIAGCVISIFSMLVWILGVLGIAFSCIGLHQIRSENRSGKGYAYFGIAIGLVMIALNLGQLLIRL